MKWGLQIFLFFVFFSVARASAATCPEHLRTLVEQSRTRVAELTKKKADPVREVVVSKKIDFHREIIYGVPVFVDAIENASGVFRHYVKSGVSRSSAEVLHEIVRSGRLRAGPTPHSRRSEWEEKTYPDLRGIFFTKPDAPVFRFTAEIPESLDYVDFEFYEGTDIVHIANEDSYLIPGPVIYQDWIKQAYRDYVSAGRISKDSVLHDTFVLIDNEGGLSDESFEIPMRIVSYRVNGKITQISSPGE